MTSWSRTALLGVLVALLLTSLLAAPLAGAQSGESSTAGSDWTLEELQRGGDQVAGAPPSLRWIDDDAAVYVDYEESNPIQDMNNPNTEWSVENLLRRGATVNQREIRLHHQGGQGVGNQTYDIHLAYYNVGERQVETDEEVVTRQVPVNVTHDTVSVSFSSAFDVETVELRGDQRFFDEGARVAMWIEGVPGARWTFHYQPLPTSRAVETTTAGDRFLWLLKEFVVYLVIGGVLGGSLISLARRKAKAGPQMGKGAWTFLLLVGGFLALMFNYEGIATLFIRGPAILAGGVVAFLTILQLEGMDEHLTRVRFVKPIVTEATSATGEKAIDAIRVESTEEKVAELPGGKLAVVRPGFGKFLARLFGGAAILEDKGDRLKTRIFDEGSTATDEWVFIHYGADEVLDYAPEGFKIKESVDARQIAGYVGGGLLLVVLTRWLIGPSVGLWTGVAAGAIVLTQVVGVRSTWVSAEYASAHERAAFVSMLYGSKEMADATTLEESLKQTYKERAKNELDVEERVETRDQTLVEEAIGLDVSATVTDESPLQFDDIEEGGDAADVEEGDDE